QQKIQIIKGKKGTGTVKNNTSSEFAPQPVAPNQADTQRAQELNARAAELDAKDKSLAEREQALDEKQQANAEAERKKAEQLKAQQKRIEKIGVENPKLWQQSSDALAGD
ncbi:MAG TPA: hypothetical protein VGE37_04210, partial [Archangium sp.]